MQVSVWFYVLCGIWAVAMIALLIKATRLCYRIEERSGRRPLKFGLPGYANVIPTAFNWRVARDAQTQAMRWRMNRLLIVILAGFALLYGLVAAFGVWS